MTEKKDWGDLKDFTPARKVKELKPMVTISKGGGLKFNEDFFTASKIKDRKIKSMKMLYSKNNRAMVLIIKNLNTLNAFRFCGKNFSNLKAKSFFDQFEIDIEKYVGKYSLVLENVPKKGKGWIIYLK